MYSIVQQPTGDILIAVTNEHNPYRKVETNSNDIIVDAYNIDREVEFVAFCCLLDGFISLMNVVMFLNPVAFFPLLASMWGYRGVCTYQHHMLVSFMVYQYLYTFGRWGLLGYSIYYTIDMDVDEDYRYWVLMCVLPVAQTYITWRVHRLYSHLKSIYINITEYNDI